MRFSLRPRRGVFIVLAALVPIACAGGGSGGPGASEVAPPPATPTPNPTATPNPQSTAPVGVSTGTISFTAPGQTFSVTAGQSGGNALTAVSSAPSVASVSPTGATPDPHTGLVTFVITAGTVAGTTTITISGSGGKTASIAVTVTTTGGNVTLLPSPEHVRA